MKILDLSCGRKAIWFDKNNPLVTFLDIRSGDGIAPDFICDTKNIPESVGKDYDLVVFDPPHENCGAKSNMAKAYGHFTRKEIIETITGSGKEAHRLTRKDALMAFKWNDCAYNLDKVLELLAPYWLPLFGHHLRNRGGSAAKTQSYWVLLLRKNKDGLCDGMHFLTFSILFFIVSFVLCVYMCTFLDGLNGNDYGECQRKPETRLQYLRNYTTPFKFGCWLTERL